VDNTVYKTNKLDGKARNPILCSFFSNPFVLGRTATMTLETGQISPPFSTPLKNTPTYIFTCRRRNNNNPSKCVRLSNPNTQSH
jgi:hypothetical protein